MSEIVKVPNIGDFKNVEIIEVLVKEGDEINKGDPVITLESDKSSVEVPSSFSGKISNINIKIGDKVSEGDQILEIATDEKSSSQQKQKKPVINKETVKELIQSELSVINLKSNLDDILDQQSYLETILRDYKVLKKVCQGKNVPKLTAIEMLKTISS